MTLYNIRHTGIDYNMVKLVIMSDIIKRPALHVKNKFIFYRKTQRSRVYSRKTDCVEEFLKLFRFRQEEIIYYFYETVCCTIAQSWPLVTFYPRDAMLARVFATATCPSVCLSHAGIVPSRAKAGS